MLKYSILLFAFFIGASYCTLYKRDYALRNYYTLHIQENNDLASVYRIVSHLDARFEGKVGELENYYWISVLKEHDYNYTMLEKLKKREIKTVFNIQPQIPSRRLVKRALPFTTKHELFMYQRTTKTSLSIDDPGFDRQWHLINTREPGHDLNVADVWTQDITGKGSIVAILDDGLDFEHDDIHENYYADGSFDFNNHGPHPKPRLDDDVHGTRCAGEIAAVKNDACGMGVAYDAKVSGIRILSGNLTEADEAAALNYKFQENQIYSCSWGPPDLGEVAEGPEGMVLEALRNGIERGRNGKGSIFVFASGNGGHHDDNLGAIDRLGNHPFYAEKCAAQFFVTYSSGSGHHIYTTDIHSGKCTENHGGTSAAAPLAAGVFALVLSVRPDLSWRDLQYLCVQSAIPISLEDNDWEKLPSGRMFNHKFGYGVLDAYRIVELAKDFQTVGPQTHLQLHSTDSLEIPDISLNQTMKTLNSKLYVSSEMITSTRLSRLEHVTVTVNIEHQKRGDLEILLISPNNVTSQLGTPRKNDHSKNGLIDWTFMSVKHWEENPFGEWTLQIIDAINPEHTGKLVDWKLTLWGEGGFAETYSQKTDIHSFTAQNSLALLLYKRSFLVYVGALFITIVAGSMFFFKKKLNMVSPRNNSFAS